MTVLSKYSSMHGQSKAAAHFPIVICLILVASVADIVSAAESLPSLGLLVPSARECPAGQETPSNELAQLISGRSRLEDHLRFLFPGTAGARYAVVNVAPDDGLNIRTGPGVSSPQINRIPYYAVGVQIRGTGEQVGSSFWVPIQYEQTRGWVNSNYLALQVGSIDGAVSARAAEIIWALRHRDLATLSRYAHPDQGVRLSPYAYVSDTDIVLSAADIGDLSKEQGIHNWGHFDGSGDPINLKFDAYFARFIYDADFARPHKVGYNKVIGSGNTINNLSEFFPGSVFVEYHFDGFEHKLGGMDWRSLRLVLAEKGGDWYLLGVVHDEWTI